MTTDYRKQLLYLSALIMDMCVGIVLFAIPLFLIERLHASAFIIGLTGSLGALGYSLFCLGTGRLSDKLGRKKVVTIGLGIFISAYFLIPFVRSLFPVFILVILGGIGMSMFWPPLQAWVAESTEKKRLIESLGIFNISWSVGLMLGSLLGGILFPLGSGVPFYFAVGQTVVLLLIILQLSEVQKRPLPEELKTADENILIDKTSFLFIAWMANFVSWFIVIMLRNLFPVLAVNLEISPRVLGVLIFLIYFSQTGMFILLRRFRGWHYRIGPLLFCQGLASIGLIIGFFTSSILLFGISFILMGVSGGMTYFSSIFYSLDSLSAKGKKTGFHESILGTGALLGPLFGGLAARYYNLRAPYLLGLILLICAMLLEVVIYHNAKTVNRRKRKNL
ncbi:MAG: MFS transporter [Nitrospirae bacterium]|nr:MFS transporter [Nitrospirota bacterium]